MYSCTTASPSSKRILTWSLTPTSADRAHAAAHAGAHAVPNHRRAFAQPHKRAERLAIRKPHIDAYARAHHGGALLDANARALGRPHGAGADGRAERDPQLEPERPSIQPPHQRPHDRAHGPPDGVAERGTSGRIIFLVD